VLIPVESADPFQLNISNTPNQIVWGNLGTTVELRGSLALGRFDTSRVDDLDITLQVGGAWATDSYCTPAFVYVPEPGSGVLIGTMLCFAVPFLRRSRQRQTAMTGTRS
jgi:hypothetical protein